MEFRRLLDTPPAGLAFVDLTQTVYNTLIESMAGDKRSVKEWLDRERRGKQDELGYRPASPLERLLIDAVVLSWLRYLELERRYSSVMAGSVTLTVGDFWEKRLTAAQRRYLRAIDALARVRRLALPSIQVNIAAQQVNQLNSGGSAGLSG